MTAPKPFQLIGPVSRDRHVYVDRPEDDRLLHILLDGHHCHLHAGRQAGKTSLLNDCRRTLIRQGHFCIREALYTHLSDHQSSLFDALHALGCSLMREASTALQVSMSNPPGSGLTVGRVIPAFLDAIAAAGPADRRLFIFLDEFDSLMNFAPSDVRQVLLHLREWCQTSPHTTANTLLFASVRTFSQMLRKTDTSGITPNFAVDVPLDLFANSEHTRRQLFEQGFPEDQPELIDALLSDVIDLTGGHPYLTSVVLGELQKDPDRRPAFSRVAEELVNWTHSRIEGHIEGLELQLLDNPETELLLKTFKRIHSQEMMRPSDGTRSATALESIGLIRVSPSGFYEVANPIYGRRLNDGWIESVRDAHQQDAKRLQALRRATTHHQPRERKQVALLFIGGTVGMIDTGDGGTTFQGAPDRFREFCRVELSPLADVEPVFLSDPMLDGINVTPREWLDLADWINRNGSEYHAVVVAHGTDTLAFTASAVAFILGSGLRVPVIFTGSQTTIDVPHGDAHDNLVRACWVAARDESIAEVQVVFGDCVYRAVRVEKADDRLYAGFRSPGWPELARITEHLLVNNYALGGRPVAEVGEDTYRPYLAANVLPLLFVPGLRPSYFDELRQAVFQGKRELDGIILHTPGVGNIPSVRDYNFRDWIRDSVEGGIPVLVTSQVPINPYTQQQYEMARIVTDYGAILAGNVTLSAALTKFAWVIGCVRRELGGSTNPAYHDEVKARMQTNYVGEQGEVRFTSASGLPVTTLQEV